MPLRPSSHLICKRYSLRAVLFIFLIFPFLSNAQYLRKDWDHDYGGTGWEECNSVIETTTGNYVMGGYTASDLGADVSEITNDLFPSPDKGDFWVLVADANGNKLDDRRYGGDRLDRLWSIYETDDGGYIMGGWSRSNVSGDKSEPSFGEMDYWIIKVDQNFDRVWDKTYGGSERDFLYELIQTSDGGFLLVGTSESGISGTKSEPHRGQFDLWIVKVDSIGMLKWEKTIGGVEEERVNDVFETPDGNYYIGGACESAMDGVDVLEPRIGGKDFWLIEIDSTDGSKIWEKRYGGIDEDEIQTMIPVSTGGFLLVGGSRSPANPPMKSENSQALDIWAVKIDDLGAIEWERTLGGSEFENCYSVKENTVGNFILGGYSGSDLSATKTSPNRGAVGTYDFWINYLSPTGVQVWDQAFGGPDADVLEDIFQTSDGGYILAGHSITDVGGDKTDPSEGLNDFWIVKTLCDVKVEFNDTIVCPKTDFVIDARDSNCVLCEWLWNDNAIDSMRTINISTDQIYSVTLTDGVGCSWSDDIQVSTFAVNPIDLGADQELCEGDSLIIGVADNPVNSYLWREGETSSSIIIDSAATYLLVVTDPNGCKVEDSLSLAINPNPTVDIGNDTSICAGATLNLDAGPGYSAYEWDPGGSDQMNSLIPTDALDVIVTVFNQFQCSASDTMNVTNVFALPVVQDVTTLCNTDNDAYQVSFSLVNYDPADLLLSGIDGNWSGNIFTSFPIIAGDPYGFSLSNSIGCDSDLQSGNGPCVCESEAGQFDQTELSICGEETQGFSYNGSFLDQNDIIEFILHDGSPSMIGNILHVFNNNEITNPGLNIGQTYFLTIRVGNDSGGSISASDACVSESTGIPVTFFDNPVSTLNTIGAQSIDCDNNTVLLDGLSSAGNGMLFFEWFTQLGNILDPTNSPQVEISSEAWYFLSVVDEEGCMHVDSIFILADEALPLIELSSPEILTCNTPQIEISALGSSSGADFDWTWSGGSIAGLSDSIVQIDSPGNYSLQVENSITGCTNVQTFEIFQNIDAPEIDAGQNQVLSCISTQAELQGTIIDNCSNCLINWNSFQGTVLNNSNSMDPTVDGLGWYFIQAENLDNGCTNFDSVQVLENDNLPQEILLNSVQPPCPGDLYGSLLIDEVIGGTAPFEFTLDGFSYQQELEFEDLIPGFYQLTVLDELGCILDYNFSINPPDTLAVFVEPVHSINLGESVFLNPIYSNNVVEVNWSGSGTEDCPDCPIQTVSPLSYSEYSFTVTNDKNCTATLRVIIDVNDDVTPFVPNAFSPNDDGINDLFLPFFLNDYIERIDNFSIFNRWGGIVHSEKNVSLYDLKGWNGKFRNKKVNPGVFVYSLSVTLINGVERNFSGDVTLLR